MITVFTLTNINTEIIGRQFEQNFYFRSAYQTSSPSR